ncbi:branched-chain amino acid transport system substrate-binding protein [Mesorhizobium albiziae]|uniref:Branched-chain amino acid transport system substrate-binding protein n=1 Tax=Neomesorhizobium albiziae TaxID=335020 RepID=A0A1I4ETX6_9HYPH|nr:ABC transporter substrate-binding protein [Mesorhizobium albiziae]GLS32673.1 ABC transporter substrate-binding protein [Mesorhizobium albiziae]SFL09144.1 branched-chain amino acid transport system substrate-binding protein [Mesorhizobium albiziae]
MALLTTQTLTRRHILKGAAAAGALSVTGLAMPAVAQERTFKIGYVSPRSGPLALFGQADEFVLGTIRTALGNGIEIGGKVYPVEIIAKDTQSSANRAAEVTSELILTDEVDLVLVSSAPETVNPVSDQCELNGTPCISTVAPWQAWMFNRGSNPEKGFESTFHFFWGFEDIISVFANMWDTVSTNRKVGGLFPNDEDGRAWSDETNGAPALLGARKYGVVPSGFYRNLGDDFSAVIKTFKDAGCELVTGAPLPPDFTTFWTQARQQGFRPKAASIAKAILFPAAVEALGDAGHNLSSEIWWSPSHPFRSSISGQSAGEYAKAYSEGTGKQWTQPVGFTHALFEVAIDVLKRVTEPGDPGATIAAISQTSLQTIVGTVDWKNSAIKNVAKTPLVGGQWRRTPNGPNAYDLVITSNQTAPEIPVGGDFEELAY